MNKKCNICGEIKLRSTEFFARERRNPDGYNYKCKVCVSEYKKIYRENNKQQISEENKQYYKENIDSIKARREGYYESNKERIDEYNRIYHKENKKVIAKRHKEYYIANREAMYEYNRIYQQQRKAKKESLPSTLTANEWNNILKHFNSKCSYCGISEEKHFKLFKEQLHQEHFIPLSKGGEFTHNNIIPACRSCNSRKNNKDFFEWYPEYEYFDKERYNFILEFLGYTDKYNQQLALFI